MQEENKATKLTAVLRYKNGNFLPDEDSVAAEEPLEIRIRYGGVGNRITQSLAVTMRTPGNDVELALGFLFTESILQAPDDILIADHVAHAKTEASRDNIVQVVLKEHVAVDLEKLKRNFYTTSSCGICGKESIDAVKMVCPDYPRSALQVDEQVILRLPDTLRQRQALFSATGGIHAAAFFDAKGALLRVREDVGRHNALDKLIGATLLGDEEPGDPTQYILLLSGRASFELIQKAAMAGVPVVCSVGAPSSLAVKMASDLGITLVGFLREDRFNIYCGSERIRLTK